MYLRLNIMYYKYKICTPYMYNYVNLHDIELMRIYINIMILCVYTVISHTSYDSYIISIVKRIFLIQYVYINFIYFKIIILYLNYYYM